MSVSKFISVATRLLSVGVSTVLWYWTYKYIYKQIDEDETEFKSNDEYSDCYKVIRMKIPSYSKGAIIGKNGSTIKRIQEKTKTTIKFVSKSVKSTTNTGDKESNFEWTVDLTKDNNSELFEILLIRGLTLRVMEAEKEIKNIIGSVPVYVEEHMIIDNRFVGKLIGKKGENIKRLKDLYRVQIDIDKTSNIQRQITIRGIITNIAECKLEIIKTIDAEMMKEKRFRPVPNIRMKSTSELSSDPNTSIDKIDATSKNTEEFRQFYVTYPGGLDEKVDIYVSSVVDCGKFYAHIINDELATLESLIDEMTHHFTQVTAKCEISFNVGDILAGFYEPSQTWQRVKIIGIEKELFEIIYLDYGDCTKVKTEDLKTFEPNSKYLELPFQALRLMTYGIQPVGECWTEKDINEFEALTKVGCTYKIGAILKKKNPLNFEVQLIDEANGIDIAETMVKNGRARLSN